MGDKERKGDKERERDIQKDRDGGRGRETTLKGFLRTSLKGGLSRRGFL